MIASAILFQVTLPTRMRSALGVAESDLVEASVQRGRIVLTPKVVVDRSNFPTADDEYTPAQRRAIDARLAKGIADMKAGRVHVPFRNHQELLDFLHAQIKKSKGKSKTKPKKR